MPVAGLLVKDDLMTIGLPSDIVRVVDYSPEWPRLFAEEAARLWAAIGAQVLDIQHMGSTSVPGLAAKPILDIAVAVASYEGAFVCVPLLEPIGYEYRGDRGIPRRHYFVRGDPIAYHVHMNEIEGVAWREHIAFRDALRADPGLVQAYAELKRALAAQFPEDREAYLNGKAAFIRRALDRT